MPPHFVLFFAVNALLTAGLEVASNIEHSKGHENIRYSPLPPSTLHFAYVPKASEHKTARSSVSTLAAVAPIRTPHDQDGMHKVLSTRRSVLAPRSPKRSHPVPAPGPAPAPKPAAPKSRPSSKHTDLKSATRSTSNLAPKRATTRSSLSKSTPRPTTTMPRSSTKSKVLSSRSGKLTSKPTPGSSKAKLTSTSLSRATSSKFQSKSTARSSTALTSNACRTSTKTSYQSAATTISKPPALHHRRWLEKRALGRPYADILPNNAKWTIRAAAYPALDDAQLSTYKGGKDKYDFTNNNIKDPSVSASRLGPSNKGDTALEHILELQTIPDFIKYAISGNIPWMKEQPDDPKVSEKGTLERRRKRSAIMVDGLTSFSHSQRGLDKRSPRISEAFFDKHWNEISLKNAPTTFPPEDNRDPGRPNDRVFEAMGSVNNPFHFVYLEQTSLNSAKGSIWQFIRPRNNKAMRDSIRASADPTHYAKRAQGTSATNDAIVEWANNIRVTLGVFNYLNDPLVSKNLVATVKDVHKELKLIEKQFPNEANGLAQAWAEFIPEYFDRIARWALWWTRGWLVEAKVEFKKQERLLKEENDEAAKKCSGNKRPAPFTRPEYMGTAHGIIDELYARRKDIKFPKITF